MNQKIPFHDLAQRVSLATGISEDGAEVFVKSFFEQLSDALLAGEPVKIKGFGSFSVNRENGDNIIEFVPDKDIADTLNAPFAPFEAVALNENVTEEMLSETEEKEEIASPAIQETESQPQQMQEPTPATVAAGETPHVDEEGVAETEPHEERPETNDAPDTAIEVKEVLVETSNVDIVETEISGTETTTIAQPSSQEPAIQPEPAPKSESAPQAAEPEPPVTPQSAPAKPFVSTTPLPVAPKFKPLEEEPEEYVSDSESAGKRGGGFTLGFIVGILVGMAIGACGVYLAIDHLFPGGKGVESVSMIQEEELMAEPVIAPIDENSAQEAESTNITESAQPAATEASDEKPSAEEPQVATPAVRYDTVQKGYLIHDMAKKYYGNKAFWVYIYEENKSKIGNPNKMQPGDKLVIPDAAKYGIDADSQESLKRAQAKAGEILSKYK